MPKEYLKIMQQNDTLVVKATAPVDIQQPVINLGRREIDTSLLQKLDQLEEREQTHKVFKQQQHIKKKSPKLKLLTPKISNPIVSNKTYTSPSNNELILPHRQYKNYSTDWITIVFILTLIILASIRVLFKKYFEQLFSSIVNPITASRMFREGNNFNILHASFRLDLFAYIMMGFLGYQTAKYFNVWPALKEFWLWGWCVIVIMLYFILKFTFYRLLGFISQQKTVTAEYIFNIKLHTKVLGIIISPLVMINTYVSADLLKSFIITGIVIVSAFYLLSLFRGILIFLRKHLSVFYLILYLCTLEILPLILIFKYFYQKVV